MKYRVIKRNSVIKTTGITSDQIIELTSKKGEIYTSTLRRVGYKDPNPRKQYCFITNNTALCAKSIADIYKDRWKIELFFKWVKQNVRIRRFIGTSKNAVMSQVWVAMCAYLLMAYFRWGNGITKNALGIVQIMRLYWFERRNIVEIFIPPDLGGGIENTQMELIETMGH